MIDLPSAVTESLRAVMAELGFVYGAFDLSMSRDGTADVFSFLEITESLVRLLAAGAAA